MDLPNFGSLSILGTGSLDDGEGTQVAYLVLEQTREVNRDDALFITAELRREFGSCEMLKHDVHRVRYLINTQSPGRSGTSALVQQAVLGVLETRVRAVLSSLRLIRQ
ncbi:hypothetical protein KW786_04045 [Candidatus Parcubacteria bacterium]|nr:hypothetical protein [Candidatus Parcubacteria bacterium]